MHGETELFDRVVGVRPGHLEKLLIRRLLRLDAETLGGRVPLCVGLS